MPKNERYAIDILDVTLDAIERMASSDREAHSASELARELQINRSRLFRILKTLERRGYVEYNPRTETYRLGLKFLTLSRNIRDRLALRREAEDLLKQLAIATGDGVHLVSVSGNYAVVIDRYLGDNMLQVAAELGELLPLHTGAAPKLLLAYMPETQRERILSEIELVSFTPYTLTDPERLARVLDEIRRSGYAVDEQELEIGVYAFGAPVFDDAGMVVAGVSVATPAVRYSPERRQQLIQMVTATAGEISTRLGYQPKPGLVSRRDQPASAGKVATVADG